MRALHLKIIWCICLGFWTTGLCGLAFYCCCSAEFRETRTACWKCKWALTCMPKFNEMPKLVAIKCVCKTQARADGRNQNTQLCSLVSSKTLL